MWYVEGTSLGWPESTPESVRQHAVEDRKTT